MEQLAGPKSSAGESVSDVDETLAFDLFPSQHTTYSYYTPSRWIHYHCIELRSQKSRHSIRASERLVSESYSMHV